MATPLRILLVCAATLMSSAALAQFGTLFGPPRPPADVGQPPPGARPPPPQQTQPARPPQQQAQPARPPFGGVPQMPPEEMDDDAPQQIQPRAPVARQQPPQQQLAPPPGLPPPGGIRSQPLPPLPGQQAAPPAQLPPGQTLPPVQQAPGQARGAPPQQPTSVAPQPGDEVITEMPSQKIANPTAIFTGLDKITGRIITFDVALNETVQFGALQVTPRICYTRPATETANTDSFVEVDEVTLQGEVKRLFAGWMFASSPGLNAVEHPIYDIWLNNCKGGTTVVADTPPPAQPQPAQRQQTPRGQQQGQQQQGQPRPQQGAPQQQQQPPSAVRQPTLQQPGTLGPPPGLVPGR